MDVQDLITPWLEPRIMSVFAGSLCLYAGLAWLFWQRESSRVLSVAFASSLLVTVLIALALGWRGGTSDAWSNFVKTGALIAAFAIPLGIAALATRFVPSSKFLVRLAVGTFIGIIISMFMPLLWLGLICRLTGDCL